MTKLPPKLVHEVKHAETKVVNKKEEPKIHMVAVLPGREIPLYKEVTLICTFYTTLEGGKLDSKGQPLSRGAAASNHIQYGTLINTEEYGTLRVVDVGSEKHFWYIDDSTYRIDIFVVRKSGESDYDYKKRVKDMGIKTIKGKILNKIGNDIDLLN
jgi:3D (Asp-Asp-Asp) domain-containing protein